MTNITQTRLTNINNWHQKHLKKAPPPPLYYVLMGENEPILLIFGVHEEILRKKIVNLTTLPIAITYSTGLIWSQFRQGRWENNTLRGSRKFLARNIDAFAINWMQKHAVSRLKSSNIGGHWYGCPKKEMGDMAPWPIGIDATAGEYVCIRCWCSIRICVTTLVLNMFYGILIINTVLWCYMYTYT